MKKEKQKKGQWDGRTIREQKEKEERERERKRAECRHSEENDGRTQLQKQPKIKK